MKGSVRIVAWSLALAVGLLVGLAHASGGQSAAAAPILAQTEDPVAVVDAFHAAGDDMDAALALLTDDVVIQLGPPAPPNTPGIWKGKMEARKFFEWRNAGKQKRVRAGDAQVTGDATEYTVTGNVGVESDMFTRLGLGTVGHTFKAEVVDGKLKSYHGLTAPEEQQRVASAILAAQRAAGQPTGMPSTGGPLILPFIITIGLVMMTVGAALLLQTQRSGSLRQD